MEPALPDKRQRAVTSLLFATILAAFCLWIFSLPLFPSQDGPMHRYYVHVLQSLLSRTHRYDVYRVRHPFPPYATHYFSLLLLYKLFSYNVAEKVFTCGLLICFGYGFRFCAMAIGPLGDLLSLCIAPLLLHWAVMMGFFNYDLALAFFLFAVGFWVRATTGKPKLWFGYAVMVLIRAVTHPVPLLVLICLCLVDILLGLVRPHLQPAGSFWEHNRWRLGALIFASLAFLYPAASLDKSYSASTLQSIGLHKEFVRTALLLTGVSPYNTRSTSLLINLYRAGLYALLLGAFILAARRFTCAWRERSLTQGDSLFASTVLLGFSLPFLPDSVNGSFYFATRLIILLWIGSMLAASGSSLPRRSKTVLVSVAVLFATLSLLTAEVYIRPVARTIYSVEQQALPREKKGLILVGRGLDNWSRFHTELAPDFFEWGMVLPFVRQDDVALDSPWLEQNILPLQALEESPLLVGDTRIVNFSQMDAMPPYADRAAAREKKTLSATSFVIYAGTQQELANGLLSRFNASQAAQFQCSQHGWYIVCLAVPSS